MALHIVPQRNFGEELGQQLSGNISSGLQTLANIKLKQMMDQYKNKQIASGLSPILKEINPNISQEEINNYANLPEPILREVLHRKMLEPLEEMLFETLSGTAQGKTLQKSLQDISTNNQGQQQPGSSPVEQIQQQQQQFQEQPVNNLYKMLGIDQLGSTFPMGGQLNQPTQMQQVQPQQPPVSPQSQQVQQQRRRFRFPLQQGIALAQMEAQNRRFEEAQKEKSTSRLEKGYEKRVKDFDAMATQKIANENTINDLNNAIEAVRSGSVIMGPTHTVLKALKLNDVFTTDATMMVEKMTQGAFNEEFKGFSKISGRPSQLIFQEMAKGYASLKSKPLVLEFLAHTKANEKKADNLVIDKVHELAKAYRSLGKPYPSEMKLDAIKMVQPQIDELVKDSNNFLKETLIKSAGGQIAQPTATFNDNEFVPERDMKPEKNYRMPNGEILRINPKNGKIYTVVLRDGVAEFDKPYRR